MIIVELNGGLGNQISQYIFSRYLEEIYGYENVLLDDSFFYCNKCHNGLELDKIFPNIKLNLLSNYFDDDVWTYMMQTLFETSFNKDVTSLYKTQDLLKDQGIEIALVCDGYWHDKNYYNYSGTTYLIQSSDFNKPDCDFKEKFAQHSNIYFMGVWHKAFFGQAIKNIIEHELKLPPFVHQENIDYKNKICSSDIAVGLHVRRGDFITVKKNISIESYAEPVKNLKTQMNNIVDSNTSAIPKINFFIFSDDIPWCKDNIFELGFDDNDDITFIIGNDVDQRNYLDIQLMTYCNFLIQNYQSTFCFSAQMISEKKITRIFCY